MSLFDYVAFEMECPVCDNIVSNFQTKDHECPYMRTLKVEDVDHYYAACPNCGAWISFHRRITKHADFDMTVTPSKDGQPL